MIDPRSNDFDTVYAAWERVRGSEIERNRAARWPDGVPGFLFDHWPTLSRTGQRKAAALMFDSEPEASLVAQRALSDG